MLEVKVRAARFYRKIPAREMIQLQTYMALSKSRFGLVLQQCGDRQRVSWVGADRRRLHGWFDCVKKTIERLWRRSQESRPRRRTEVAALDKE